MYSVATEIQNASIDLVLSHIGQQRQISEEKDISELKEPQTSIDTMPWLRSQQETDIDFVSISSMIDSHDR